MMMADGRVLLDVKNLSTHFLPDEGLIKAVDNVSFHIGEGETLGLVGESGCGKSVTALSVLRLIPTPPGRVVSGEIWLEGQNLLDLTEVQMRDIRGNRISMIFQEPMTSLNPVHRVGAQVAEAVRLHQGVGRKEARLRAVEMLDRVGIPDPDHR